MLEASVSRAILFCGLLRISLVTSSSQAGHHQKRSDDAGSLELLVTQLSQQVTSLTAQLAQISTELAAVKLKTRSLDTAVAFHAWGSAHPIHTLPHGNLILDHVTTNLGNAYDPSTGVFVAPVAGLYSFLATIMEYSTSGYVNAAIMVDGSLQCMAISDNRNGANYDQSPLHVVTHVAAGARVTLQSTSDTVSNFYGGSSPYTTFSGFLVKAD